MKTSVQINLPVEKVFKLFMDKNNFKNWKKDFISYEQISGSPDETGSVSKLVYTNFEMLETIVSKKFPSEFQALYEYKRGGKTQMLHKAINKFTSLDANKTLVEVDLEIVEVYGFFMNLMIRMMAGAGKKISQDQLNQLKVFAEGERVNEQ